MSNRLPTLTLTLELDIPGEPELTRITSLRSYETPAQAIAAAQQAIETLTTKGGKR